MIVTDTTELRHAIARAVLDDLEDRRGIKWELWAVRDEHPDTYREIEEAVAAKVMKVLAAAPAPPQSVPPYMLKLADDSGGYRDLYWCWIVNEPAILVAERMCGCCGWEGVTPETPQHTFYGHILKPPRAAPPG